MVYTHHLDEFKLMMKMALKYSFSGAPINNWTLTVYSQGQDTYLKFWHQLMKPKKNMNITLDT